MAGRLGAALVALWLLAPLTASETWLASADASAANQGPDEIQVADGLHAGSSLAGDFVTPGFARELLAKKASLPLRLANTRAAEIERLRGDQLSTGRGGSHALAVDSGEDEDADTEDATETVIADSRPRSRGGSLGFSSSGLGSKILGGLRGQAQQAVAGSLRAGAAGPGGALDADNGVDEDEEFGAEDEDDDPLSAWWQPGGSQWRPPVKPFVVKRPFLRPGEVVQTRSTFQDLTSYIPGFRGRAGIPKIFHQVYIEGQEALERAEAAAAAEGERWPPVKREWRAGCKALHPDWEFRLWNLSSMEDLLAERYPWFLPTFQTYPQLIYKVDAVRPFIMHAFGGVYIDMDVECLQPVELFLHDHDLVFQEEDFGAKSLVNSAVAGVPGHHFWDLWQQILFERAPELHKRRGLFAGSDFEVIRVLRGTGPWTLREAFLRFGKDYGLLHSSYVGSWTINETNVMVYPVGTWYVPCLWSRHTCHAKVEALVQQGEIPAWLAGHHKNAGSWFKAAHFSRNRTWWRSPANWAGAGAGTGLCSLVIWRRRRRLQPSTRSVGRTKRRD